MPTENNEDKYMKDLIAQHEEWLNTVNDDDKLYKINEVITPLANLYRKTNQIVKELPLRKQIADFWRESEDQENYARSLSEMALAVSRNPLEDKNTNIEKAIDLLLQAIQLLDTKETSIECAITKSNMGFLYCYLLKGNRDENLEAAIKYFNEALSILNEIDFPMDYAKIQFNIGTAYQDLENGDRIKNLTKATTAYEEALLIYTEELGSLCSEADTIRRNLEKIFNELLEKGRERQKKILEAGYPKEPQELDPDKLHIDYKKLLKETKGE